MYLGLRAYNISDLLLQCCTQCLTLPTRLSVLAKFQILKLDYLESLELESLKSISTSRRGEVSLWLTSQNGMYVDPGKEREQHAAQLADRRLTWEKLYFHRPLHELFGVFFKAGLVMDALEEPTFSAEQAATGDRQRTDRTQIPVLLAFRLRLAK